MTISAIETKALGYRFRSRTEARWAIFFDAGHIRYEYEPEGIKDGDIMYLPDFYLPDFDLYVEVKPERPGALEELKKPLALVHRNKIQRLLILPNIPQKTEFEYWWYLFAYYHNGVQGARTARAAIIPWGDGELRVVTNWAAGYDTPTEIWGDPSFCTLRPHCIEPIHDKDMPYGDGPSYTDLIEQDGEIDDISVAYDKARTARFEHGETL